MKNACSYCGSEGHSSIRCFSKPRTPLKSKKRIRKLGKKGRKWVEDRHEYLKENPPDHAGYRYCVVGGKALPEHRVTLDHDEPRSRGGKNDDCNLNVMCLFHNHDKGSRTLEQYRATNPPPCP